MALSQATLAAKIVAEITALYGAPQNATILQNFANALAKAIVDEIQANAVVLPTALVAPNGGGAVTGTGTVT